MHRFVVLIVLLGCFALPTIAQEATPDPEATEPPLPVQPQLVEVAAPDELTLVGDFYLVDPARPTVILLHELYQDRTSWQPLLRPLLENGYNLLAVDVRGMGATRGAINWRTAVDDVDVWMTWLRDSAGVNPNAISTLGSSIGSSLAVLGCAADDACPGAIALSPGWNYYGLRLEESLPTKPVLAIYAERDRWSALGVPRMEEAAPETFATQTYPGNAHGMTLVEDELETIVPQVLEWLAAHGG